MVHNQTGVSQEFEKLTDELIFIGQEKGFNDDQMMMLGLTIMCDQAVEKYGSSEESLKVALPVIHEKNNFEEIIQTIIVY